MAMLILRQLKMLRKNNVFSFLGEKNKKLPLAAKASIWFVICSVLQKGIALLTTPIFTRLMSTEQFGQVTIYNSWVEVFTIFATLNLFYGVYNNALSKYPEDRDVATSSMQGLCTTITLGIFAIYLIFQQWINILTKMSTLMTCLLFAEILFIPAFRFWSSKQRFEYKYKLLVILTLLVSLLTTGLGVPAVILFEEKGIAKIVTSVISILSVSICLYFFIFIKGKKFFSKKYWKWALMFNLPLIPHYLSSVVLNQSDRIMIDNMVGTSQAGIYGLAYTIGALAIIFNEAIMNSFMPWTYQHLKTKDFSRIKNISLFLVIFIAVLSVCLVLFAPEAIWILGGDKYSDGVWIIAPVAISIFFRFLYSMYANVEFYYEKNIFIMFASVITALTNIALNYVFINLYGYLAAGFTTLVCFAIYAFSHYVFSSLIVKKKCDGESVYNNKLILLISVLTIAISAVIMLFYKYWYIRYSLVLCIFVVAIIFRKQIIGVFRQIKRKGDNFNEKDSETI